MKYLLIAVAAVGLTLPGCETSRDRVQPSDSRPDLKTGNVSQPEVGTLIVRRSDPTPLPRENSGVPTAYAVYDSDGRLVRNADREDMTLPAGRYIVRLQDATHHPKEFWVTVESNRTTEVDLAKLSERETRPPRAD